MCALVLVRALFYDALQRCVTRCGAVGVHTQPADSQSADGPVGAFLTY